MSYIIKKGFSFSEDNFNSTLAFTIGSGSILDNNNNYIIAVRSANLIKLSGQNYVYYDVTNEKLFNTSTEKTGNYVLVYNFEVQDEEITKITSYAPSAIDIQNFIQTRVQSEVTSTFTQNLDKSVKNQIEPVVQNNINKAVQDEIGPVVDDVLGDLVQDKIEETSTKKETLVVDTDTVTCNYNISKILYIYIDNYGTLDLESSINSIEDNKITLEDDTLDGLTAEVYYY
jgi:hypothetical protein